MPSSFLKVFEMSKSSCLDKENEPVKSVRNHRFLELSDSFGQYRFNEPTCGKIISKSNPSRHQPYALSKPGHKSHSPTNNNNRPQKRGHEEEYSSTIFTRLTNISNSLKSIFIRSSQQIDEKSEKLNNKDQVKEEVKELVGVGAQPSTPKSAVIKWTCMVCLSKHKLAVKVCTICGSANELNKTPVSTSKFNNRLSSSSSSLPKTPTTLKLWICMYCHFSNDSLKVVCMNCRTAKKANDSDLSALNLSAQKRRLLKQSKAQQSVSRSLSFVKNVERNLIEEEDEAETKPVVEEKTRTPERVNKNEEEVLKTPVKPRNFDHVIDIHHEINCIKFTCPSCLFTYEENESKCLCFTDKVEPKKLTFVASEANIEIPTQQSQTNLVHNTQFNIELNQQTNQKPVESVNCHSTTQSNFSNSQFNSIIKDTSIIMPQKEQEPQQTQPRPIFQVASFNSTPSNSIRFGLTEPLRAPLKFVGSENNKFPLTSLISELPDTRTANFTCSAQNQTFTSKKMDEGPSEEPMSGVDTIETQTPLLFTLGQTFTLNNPQIHNSLFNSGKQESKFNTEPINQNNSANTFSFNNQQQPNSTMFKLNAPSNFSIAKNSNSAQVSSTLSVLNFSSINQQQKQQQASNNLTSFKFNSSSSCITTKETKLVSQSSESSEMQMSDETDMKPAEEKAKPAATLFKFGFTAKNSNNVKAENSNLLNKLEAEKKWEDGDEKNKVVIEKGQTKLNFGSKNKPKSEAMISSAIKIEEAPKISSSAFNFNMSNNQTLANSFTEVNSNINSTAPSTPNRPVKKIIRKLKR